MNIAYNKCRHVLGQLKYVVDILVYTKSTHIYAFQHRLPSGSILKTATTMFYTPLNGAGDSIRRVNGAWITNTGIKQYFILAQMNISLWRVAK